MKRAALLTVKALFIILLFAVIQQMVNSSLDIYNNFAYDKAVLRYTPYGYVSLLDDPNDYHSSNAEVKGGDFVYVENWESADNGSIVFAKVRSKFSSGYVNNRMLVEARINVMPIFSVVMLTLIFIYTARKVYLKKNKAY
ncbi:MAG: hypothetical protein J0M37_06465 [Ignavibacteria bacterium]|nr:hypothetical protein [Ignavibacteria bacterium]